MGALSVRSLVLGLGLVGGLAACGESTTPSSPLDSGGNAAGGNVVGGGGAAAGTSGASGGAAGVTGDAGGGSGASGAAAGQSAGGSGAAGESSTAGQAGTAGAGGGNTLPPAPGASALGEQQLPGAGLTTISYGGYLNGESFQQDGIITHKGYQYAAFWNSARHVVLSRRALPDGKWASIELADYTNSENDAHNTISLGVSPADGALHVAFDHHGSPLHYRRSKLGLLDAPAQAEWKPESFGAVQGNLVAGQNLAQVTYPRFITEPGGQRLLLSLRLGASGAGDEHLWEYDAATHVWLEIGKYIDGISDSVNAYVHGIGYGEGTQRLHVGWCWRDTSNASTNHDLLYLYSDDHGRTWHDNSGKLAGTSGSKPVERDTAGLSVVAIGQNRGLINQEHLVVDAKGRVHALLSHLPDSAADDTNFDSARQKSEYFHYLRDESGKWSRRALGQPAVAAFRGKLALSSSGNLYAVLPNLRIAAASVSDGFAAWKLLVPATPARFFSDPLIDAVRLLEEDVLSVVYPEANSPDMFVLDYALK